MNFKSSTHKERHQLFSCQKPLSVQLNVGNKFQIVSCNNCVINIDYDYNKKIDCSFDANIITTLTLKINCLDR